MQLLNRLKRGFLYIINESDLFMVISTLTKVLVAGLLIFWLLSISWIADVIAILILFLYWMYREGDNQ
jgi:hypothetical protein